MRNVLFAVTCLLAVHSAQAQINPRKGYIITHENDTVRGTIDFRTDARNGRECVFCPSGSTEYQTYTPSDISGFRLEDDGAYYVVRTFPVEGVEKTFFAEFLLQGGISLYRHKELATDYYYLVDPEGKVAEMKKLEVKDQTDYDRALELRRNLGDALQMLSKSPKAQRRLWQDDTDARHLIPLTRHYNEEFCTEYGECVEFQRNSKKMGVVVFRPRVEAGVLFGKIKGEADWDTDEIDISVSSPQVAVGFDLIFPRFNRHFALQMMPMLSRWKGTSKREGLLVDKRKGEGNVRYTNLEIQFGAAYEFLLDQKVSPVVRAGYSFNQILGMRTSNLHSYRFVHAKNEMCNGFYVGAGANVAVGKHQLCLLFNYTPRWESQGSLFLPSCSVNAGFVF